MQCPICTRPIAEGEEVEPVKDGYAHRDCYFDEIGKLIDEQPIVSPIRAPLPK